MIVTIGTDGTTATAMGATDMAVETTTAIDATAIAIEMVIAIDEIEIEIETATATKADRFEGSEAAASGPF